MTREDITRTIAAYGYHTLFNERVHKRGDGRTYSYVMAQSKDKKRTRSLGKLEDVLQISEDELKIRIRWKMEQD